MKKKHKNSISSRKMHGKWEEVCEYGNNNNNTCEYVKFTVKK